MTKRLKNPAYIAVLSGIASIAVMLGILFAAVIKADGEKTGGKLFGLMYHQVLKDPAAHNDYCVSPDELESDLKYLKENGFVSFLPEEMIKIADSGAPLPEKAVMITFDDGYETMLGYVLPLLEKYDMKATINIVGDFTDEYTALPDNEKNLSFAYLTWNEVKQLNDSGRVEIGNHTYYMHRTGSSRQGSTKNYNESEAEYRGVLYADVQKLQLKLSQLINKRPAAFAYPFGMMCDGEQEILESAGFELFMTCRELPSEIGGTPVIINRYNRAHGRTAEQLYSLYLSQL